MIERAMLAGNRLQGLRLQKQHQIRMIETLQSKRRLIVNLEKTAKGDLPKSLPVEGVQLTKRILWHESKLKNLSKVYIPAAEETVAQARVNAPMRKPGTPPPLKFDLDLDAVDDRLLENLHIPAAEETVAQATQASQTAMRKPLPLPLNFDLDLDAVDERLFEKLEKVGVQVEAKSRQTGESRQRGGNCGIATNMSSNSYYRRGGSSKVQAPHQLVSIKKERQDVANSGRPDRTLVSIKQEVGHVGLNAAEMNDPVKKTLDKSLARVKVEAPHHVDLTTMNNVHVNNLPVASWRSEIVGWPTDDGDDDDEAVAYESDPADQKRIGE